MVRVRFAPSPTGFLHIGGARTALFNWLYARNQSGKFILRIEDTDLERSKKEFFDEILRSMQWLGLNWDEQYLQSDRFDLYRQYAKKLVDEGKAYREGEAVILNMPPKEVKIFDLIRGEIVFDTELLKDQVLLKSDGSPTYSFACVVDDALMEISHVIRGEDHISNTPKQVMIYEALGFKPPKFAHLPLILDAEGGRMSKRHGAVAVSDYNRQGFLPEAVVNYLMLLGWSPGQNQEIISLSSAIAKFSIKKVNKAGAVFSMEKLTWLNAQYIKNLAEDKLTDLLIPRLQARGFIGDTYDRKRIENIVRLYKTRTPTLNDFFDRAAFLFVDSPEIADAAKAALAGKNLGLEFQRLIDKLNAINEFTTENTERAFRDVVAETGRQSADLVHPVRVALTGSDVGPGLFETMVVLGKEKTVQRLSATFNH